MNGRWLGRGGCTVVDEDIARARSTLIALRTKIDTKGHAKVYAYGNALRHVARLIADTFGSSDVDALTARGMTPDELDQVYRDLLGSTRRCKSFLQEGAPGQDIADNLVTACSLLKNLYRMRFHEAKAHGSQQVEAADLAERLMTMGHALSHLELQDRPTRFAVPMAVAA
jgi:hypothetical protein